jgi:hypothetical protein
MKMMTIAMPDGSVWGVPVEMIALNHATYYASEFGDDVERSLAEGTLPYFEENEYGIIDWAIGNMDWSDFNGHQVKISDAPPQDFNAAWLSGANGFVEL